MEPALVCSVALQGSTLLLFVVFVCCFLFVLFNASLSVPTSDHWISACWLRLRYCLGGCSFEEVVSLERKTLCVCVTHAFLKRLLCISHWLPRAILTLWESCKEIISMMGFVGGSVSCYWWYNSSSLQPLDLALWICHPRAMFTESSISGVTCFLKSPKMLPMALHSLWEHWHLLILQRSLIHSLDSAANATSHKHTPFMSYIQGGLTLTRYEISKYQMSKTQLLSL